MRTQALWKGSKIVRTGVPFCFVLCWIAGMVCVILFVNSIQFINTPLGLTGCWAISADIVLLIGLVIAVNLYHIGLLILMVIAAVSFYRMGGRRSFFNAVYRDGLLYYVYMFALSVTNFILILKLPPDMAIMLTTLVRGVHSMLTSRLVLQIRKELTGNNRLHNQTGALELSGGMIFHSDTDWIGLEMSDRVA
ncbi:hypothetical protein K435DRAFT_69297 [Dendrothele bispora CBS 962.96]|uniref:Uncharacterized protein n=1 Tax=Dendrothele bispora (strain CBS 962.96) TaxID=1314807 RepID=A0A4S8M669_DENBC|nr:hypothetical protein K435DRAFT_69297 [Dendrothele bispora CBS 962.96]